MFKRKKSSLVCFALLIGGIFLYAFTFTAYGSDLSKPKSISVPLVQKGPDIDGHLDDAVWKQASLATNFLDLNRIKKTVSEQTSVLILRDKENLYLGFTCYSARPTEIIADKTIRDARRLYKDDVVEIFIDPQRTKHDSYHFIINSKGTLWDAEEHRLLETERMIVSPQWNSKTLIKTSKGEKAWFVEVKIPLNSFPVKIRKALESKPWGLQFGRENRSVWEKIKKIGNEYSTWSTAYSFSEPDEFGSAYFADKAIREIPIKWQQEVDDSMLITKAPEPTLYNFTRVFDFGPPIKNDPIEISYIKNAKHVSSSTHYSKVQGYGFIKSDGVEESVYAKKNFPYCIYGYSPLVRDYIYSSKPAEFQFDIPKGKYRASVICGRLFTRKAYAPMDMKVSIGNNDAVFNVLHSSRMITVKTIDFESNGSTSVKVKFSGTTEWVCNGILIYPVKDHPKANRAVFWLEREFMNYPFKEYIRKKAKLWVQYPPKDGDMVTKTEREQGFSFVNLPSAYYLPRNYIPQKEDNRQLIRVISSPGQQSSVQLAFCAFRNFKALNIKVDKFLAAEIKIRPYQAHFQFASRGRASMGQYGYVPRLLMPAEPTWVEKNTCQSYMIFFDIAENMMPGIYNTKITIRNGKKILEQKSIRILVMPFKPKNNKQINSVYYNPPVFSLTPWSSYTAREKELITEHTRYELRDLKRHGINHVLICADRKSYEKGADGMWHYVPSEPQKIILNLLKEIGIKEYISYIAGFDAYGSGPFILNEFLKAGGFPLVKKVSARYVCKGNVSKACFDTLSRLTRENITYRKKNNLPIPAFELWDEPGSINSPALAPFLDAIHKGGGKTAVTLIPACFPALDGKVDVKVYNGISLGVAGSQISSPEEVLKYRANEKSDYLIYPNSTIMGSDPRVARFVFGYWGWSWNLSGLNPYKYWKICGDIYDSKSFQPMVFNQNGDTEITTHSWEMHADAIYDNNLLHLLEKTVRTSSHPKAPVVRKFITDLKNAAARVSMQDACWPYSQITGELKVHKNVWPASRYDYLRAKICEYLIILQGKEKTYTLMLNELKAMESLLHDREKSQTERNMQGKPKPRKGNLLENVGFEDIRMKNKKPLGFVRWTKTASIQDKVKHSGKYAVQIQHTPQKNLSNDGFRWNGFKLVPGYTYDFEIWIKRKAINNDVSVNTGFWFHTYKNDQHDQFIRRILFKISKATPSFEWQKVNFSFVAGKNEKYLVPWLYYVDGNSTIWLDDVMFTENAD